MEKERLLDFVGRYHLGGEIEATVWETTGGSLLTRFITGDKSMIGDVTMNNFVGFEDGVELGVLTTSQLVRMLSVLNDDVNLKINKIDNGDEVKHVSIDLVDNSNDVTYMLSDLSVVQRSKGLKQTPDFHLTFNLTKDFVDTYIKAKAALSETKIFTILKDKSGEYKVVLGYSQVNTNRITMGIEVAQDGNVDRPISFNAEYFKNILTANKGAKLATLKVSGDGLAHVHIEDGDYIANYYLVEAETDA
jgi:hypothetical protein